jgi:hypothetical protein
MKTYIDHGNTITLGNQRIPKDSSNKDYALFLEELQKNEAELVGLNTNIFTWEDIRAIRNGLLKETDWTDLPSTPLRNKQAWVDYRQDLRDITETFRTPNEVVWPKRP